MIHVGVDVGTTNITVVAVDGGNGRVVSCRSLPNPRVSAGNMYAYTQDPAVIECSVRTLLDSLEGPVASICVTGQVHGILYHDAMGRAVSPLYTWLDQRALVEVDGVTTQQRLRERTGMLLPSGYGLLTHYANRFLRQVPSEAVGFCGILEYVTSRLTGSVLAKTDPSCLGPFGAFDPVSLRFDSAVLAEVFGSDGCEFLRASDPFEIAGYTSDGIPVAYPVGDNQAGFFGMVAEPAESCLVSIGTSGQISLFSTSVHCPDTMELRPFFGQGYLHVGATLTAGKAYETVHRFFKSVLHACGAESLDDETLFAIMKREAVREGQGEPLEVCTMFTGTRRDPSVRGSIRGIGLDNLTMGNLVKGTVEGIVGELYEFAHACGGVFAPVRHMVATGSSIRRNEVFRDALGRRFALPVKVAEIDDGAGLGAALVGAVGTGVVSLEDKKGLVRSLIGT